MARGWGRMGKIGRRTGVLVGATALVGALGMPTASAATGATAGGASPSATVAQGVDPAALPGARAVAATPADTTMHVSFVLKLVGEPGLAAEVTSGWQGRYLSTAQFAQRYGQSPALIAKLTSYLSSFGITSHPLADDVDVETTGTASDYDAAMAVDLQQYALPATADRPAQTVRAAAKAPRLPAPVADAIEAVLGLSSYAPYADRAVRALGAVRAAPAADITIPPGQRTPQQFADDYDLDPLEAAGAHGQGQTIGIVTLASVNPGAPQKFWSDALHLPTSPDRLSTVDVDGGAGAPSLTAGSDETNLDAEQSGAIADQAQVRIYQAPNTDNGFADGFFEAAADDVAGSVTSSWGEGETLLQEGELLGEDSPTYVQAYDESFLELAAQGQATFIASGDSGAYGSNDGGADDLSTGTPDDSPYVTSAGGTTLPGTITLPVLDRAGSPTAATESVTIPTQRAWSWDYLWPLYRTQAGADGTPFASPAAAAVNLVVGDTGGFSALEARPSYQQGIPGISQYQDYQYLTGTDVTTSGGLAEPSAFGYTPDPPLASGTDPSGRVEPDVAYDADPYTGYGVYDPDFVAAYGAPVVEFGGTSFVAPQLAAASAVMQSAGGHRVGFWNPAIYGSAEASSSPFNPIDNDQVYGSRYFFQTSASGTTRGLDGRFANDNLYFTGTPGKVFDPATGLGVGALAGVASELGA